MIQLEEARCSTCACQTICRGNRRTRNALRVTVIDSETWKQDSVEAKRLPAADGESKWQVGDGLWTFDSAGGIRGTDQSAMNRATRRATAQEAAAIDYLKMSPRELLTFPVKLDIAFPEAAKKIAVRLTWKDFPIESMQLEDSRQPHHLQRDREWSLPGRSRADPADGHRALAGNSNCGSRVD